MTPPSRPEPSARDHSARDHSARDHSARDHSARDARDRDAGGRARNSRPRDAEGRPLARGAAGVARVPEELRLAPADALREAQRLLDAGLPFQAHEILEGTWKDTTGPLRAFWQGLAQLAVGLTHAQRGNAVGATALLDRGAQRILPFAPERPYGVDVTGLVTHAERLAEVIGSLGLDGLAESDLRPRLRREVPDGS